MKEGWHHLLERGWRRKPPSPTEFVVVGLIAVGASVLKWAHQMAPQLQAVAYLGLVLGGAWLTFVYFQPSKSSAAPDELQREMMDMAGVRVALSGYAFDAIRGAVKDSRGTAKVHEVKALVAALLANAEAWVFTSLDSTPRRPFSQLALAATRLMDDAVRRFPAARAPSPTTAPNPFRASTSRADSLFVVSLVFTSRANITDHKGESHQETRALLEELGALAGQVHTLDVFVSDTLSIDELAKRDPAMRGIA
jgi:hypothetical protein